MRGEKFWSLRRSEFERCPNLAQMLAHGLLHHFQQARRRNVQNPALKTCAISKVAGQCCHLLPAQVNEQSLGQDEDSLRATVEFCKESPARVGIRQIQPNALKRANRVFIGQNPFFVGEDFR